MFHLQSSCLRLVAILVIASISGCTSYEGLGDTAAENQDWDEAVRKYELALREDPGNAVLGEKRDQAVKQAITVHFEKAQVFLDQEQYGSAISEFQRVLNYDSQHSSAKEGLAKAKAGKKRKEYEALVRQGREFIREKLLGKAKQVLNRAIRNFEYNDEAKQELGKLEILFNQFDDHMRRGNSALQREDWTKASQHFVRALDFWANNPKALGGKKTASDWISYHQHLDKGKGFAAMGKDKKAFFEFSEARKYRETAEVKRQLSEVADRLYRPAFEEAKRAQSAAERFQGDFATWAQKQSDALALFEEALSYKDTQECRTPVADIRQKLSSKASRRGKRALSYMDYESAEEYLEVAARHGANVDEELLEAKYQKALWAGYQAEAEGRDTLANKHYTNALVLRRTHEAQVALWRSSGSQSVLPSAIQLTLSDEVELERRTGLVRQAAIIEFIKAKRSSDFVTEYDFKDPRLGSGVDTLNLDRKSGVLEGAERSERKSQDEMEFREGSSLISRLDYSGIEAGIEFGIGILSVGSKVRYMESDETSRSTYSLDLLHHIVKRRRHFRDVKIRDGIDDIDMGEWIKRYGTHFVAELWEGGWLRLNMSTEEKSHTKRREIAGELSGSYGLVSGHVSAEKVIKEFKHNSQVHVKVKTAGYDGEGISNYDEFISHGRRFSRNITGDAVVKVMLRPYESLGAEKGFPFDAHKFATVVRRLRATKYSDHVFSLVKKVGSGNFASARTLALKEWNRNISGAVKLLEGKFAAINEKDVKYSKWGIIDLTKSDIAEAAMLKSVTLHTDNKDKVEVFLLPLEVYPTLKEAEVWQDGLQFKRKFLDWLKEKSLAYFNTDPKPRKNVTKKLSLSLKKTQYIVLIYNQNAIEDADARFTASIELKLVNRLGALNNEAWNSATEEWTDKQVPGKAERAKAIRAIIFANEAVRMAEKYLDKNDVARYLDTQAAANWVVGRRGEAIRIQERALRLVTSTDSLYSELRNRLAAYKVRRNN